MNKSVLIKAVAILAILASLNVTSLTAQLTAGNGPTEYLVQLHDHLVLGAGQSGLLPTVEQEMATLAATYNTTVLYTWSHGVLGGVMELTALQAQQLELQTTVKAVEPNQSVADIGGAGSCVPPGSLAQGTSGFTQSLTCNELDPREAAYDCVDNWGLDRIDQLTLPRDLEYNYDTDGAGVHVYIIDTGLNDTDFVEWRFRVNRGAGANVTITDDNDPLRDNTADCSAIGHGTHVAGIIGSATYGVAKAVRLHPVKFIDKCECGANQDPDDNCMNGRRGGTYGHVMLALDYILENLQTPAVVNMSGANDPGWSEMIADQVQEVLDTGVQFVQAAGNQDQAIACDRSVAGHGVDDAIIVGGSDINRVGQVLKDGRWRREGPLTTGATDEDPSYDLYCDGATNPDCGSNTGTCIDLWAPAAHVVSTAKSVGNCRLSGTSMAAPHVTGVVARYLEANPSATPIQVKQAILAQSVPGVLEQDPSSAYSIGNSPNLLLQTHLNQAPVGVNDLVQRIWQSTVTIASSLLLADDSDPDGDPLEICAVGDVQHGTVTLSANGNEITYQSVMGVFFDTFEYQVCDGRGGFDYATVWVDLGGI